MEHIVIIGNGVSGITAARHIRKKSDFRITVISSETDYFFSRTALMYIFMGHMNFKHTQPYENWFWKKNRIELVKAHVNEIDTDNKALVLDNGNQLSYDKLVLATGSKPNMFGWPGQDLDGVQGMYSKQDLDKITKYSKDCNRAVIVGGGLIGIEMAEMLAAKGYPVTFLVREDSFWNRVLPKGQSEMVNRHIKEHHIDLQLSTNLVEIIPDENGRVKAVTTDKGETIECNLVGLTAGVAPNINFVKSSKIETNRGILVNRHLETSVEGVYAIGDCAEQREAIGERRPIEAVWYTGRMMGETVARTITGNRTEYQPGHWFNSAKFLDIEYQTYGWVWADPKPNEAGFYWEHSGGKKSIYINFDKETHKFIGINNFGIRMRHEVFDKWLREEQSVEYVMQHLKDPDFDPEFYKQHEDEIVNQFNKEHKTNIVPKKRSWKRIFNLA